MIARLYYLLLFLFFSDFAGKKYKEPLGIFNVDLDGRFSSIRSSETNLGNFFCDIAMTACKGDFAIINSGTFRLDRIQPAGVFTMGDLLKVLPMLQPIVVLEITGWLRYYVQLICMFNHCFADNSCQAIFSACL